MTYCPQSDFASFTPCFILLHQACLYLWRGIDTVTLRSVNQPVLLLPISFTKSIITLWVQPCAVTTAVCSHCFLRLMRRLFIGWGESPLRIGCKVSVIVTRSGVVLDNVTRWKWVKEIGNHQYASCVNWRRSWFMAAGYSVHTCWIYSFFPPFLSPGSRTGKGAFLCSSSPPPRACCQWHFVMDSPERGFFKMSWAPSVGSHSDWVRQEGGEREGNTASLHHLICHVRLSVSLFTWGLRWRRDSCGFSKASQQLQTPHGTASVRACIPTKASYSL